MAKPVVAGLRFDRLTANGNCFIRERSTRSAQTGAAPLVFDTHPLRSHLLGCFSDHQRLLDMHETVNVSKDGHAFGEFGHANRHWLSTTLPNFGRIFHLLFPAIGRPQKIIKMLWGMTADML